MLSLPLLLLLLSSFLFYTPFFTFPSFLCSVSSSASSLPFFSPPSFLFSSISLLLPYERIGRGVLVFLFFVGLVYPYSRACNDGPSPGARPAAGKKKKGPPQAIKGCGVSLPATLVPPRLREYPRDGTCTRTVGTPSKESVKNRDTTPYPRHYTSHVLVQRAFLPSVSTRDRPIYRLVL